MDLNKWQKKVKTHHIQMFPWSTLEKQGLKLGEESGEVMRAIVRHYENRKGGQPDDIAEEIGDVFICLLRLLSELDLDAEEVLKESVKKFLNRTWNINPPTPRKIPSPDVTRQGLTRELPGETILD